MNDVSFFVICSRYICAGVIIFKALTKIARLFNKQKTFHFRLKAYEALARMEGINEYMHEMSRDWLKCMKWAEID